MEKLSKSKILIGLFAAGILIFLIIVGGSDNWPPKEIDKSLIDEEIGIITLILGDGEGSRIWTQNMFSLS